VQILRQSHVGCPDLRIPGKNAGQETGWGDYENVSAAKMAHLASKNHIPFEEHQTS
jgi:hypothetical protein